MPSLYSTITEPAFGATSPLLSSALHARSRRSASRPTWEPYVSSSRVSAGSCADPARITRGSTLQANLISDPSLLTAAASIGTLEARHQSLLNALNGGSYGAQAFDLALPPQAVLALASGFLTGCQPSDLCVSRALSSLS